MALPILRTLTVSALCTIGVEATMQAGSSAVIHPREVVSVAFDSASLLPEATRRQLATEVRRIWDRQAVRIEGLDLPAVGPGDLRIELLSIPAVSDLMNPDTLAVFTRSDRLVTIFLDAAERVVRAGIPDGDGATWPAVRRHLALGYVLGRAIAHEIGHYLLGPRHTREGLMRERFTPVQLVDPRGGLFGLDRQELARLGASARHPIAAGPD